jgi:hypothetical protein
MHFRTYIVGRPSITNREAVNPVETREPDFAMAIAGVYVEQTKYGGIVAKRALPTAVQRSHFEFRT